MSSSASLTSKASGIFAHCHWDNPLFCWGMAWIAFLALTYAGTLYYKCKEAREAKEAEEKK